MADSKVSITESGTTNLDTEALTIGANTVHRERMQMAGSGSAEIAVIKNAAPATTAYGLGVREINISQGTALLGKVGIDQTTPGTTNKVRTDPTTATLTIYNLTLTSADTEYSQALPTNCRGWDFQQQSTPGATTYDIRWSNVTGKVATPTAPWAICKAGNAETSGPINQGASPETLYFACATAGAIVEIRAWT